MSATIDASFFWNSTYSPIGYGHHWPKLDQIVQLDKIIQSDLSL